MDANELEVQTAAMRLALDRINKWWGISYAQEAGTGDMATITQKELNLRRAVEAARDIANAALLSDAGKALLDRLKAAEVRVELLHLLAEGCPEHRGYRAKRKPTATGCDCCNRIWEARVTLDKLDARDAREKEA